MYCINCGVKLGDTEQRCPLCSTAPGEYDRIFREADPLYPSMQYPENPSRRGIRNGAIIFLFAIPMLLTLIIDLQIIPGLQWFWYAGGALVLSYVVTALPAWFRKPNPVIFVPCDFGAVALYLLLISCLTEGNWFLTFALPLTGSVCLITTAVITLVRYVPRGRLFIYGGFLVLLGAQLLLTEWLICRTFSMSFIGWSICPLAALAILGGLLIYLGISSTARERMERKFFL